MSILKDPDKKCLGNWYWSMTKNQKVLCWCMGVLLLILPWLSFLGIISLALLAYCQLGKERYVKETGGEKIDLNKNNHLN